MKRSLLLAVLFVGVLPAAASAAPILSGSLSGNHDQPTITLMNQSTAGESIVEFSMTIGDLSFNFDRAINFQSLPGLTPTLITPDTINNGVRDDFLFITYTGFGPGFTSIFEAELDPDSLLVPNAIVDYRTILFQRDGPDPPITSNALVSVLFDNGTLFQQRLPNYASNTADTYPFTLQSPEPPPVQPVPEPSTLLMFGGMALAAGAAAWLRRRRGGVAA